MDSGRPDGPGIGIGTEGSMAFSGISTGMGGSSGGITCGTPGGKLGGRFGGGWFCGAGPGVPITGEGGIPGVGRGALLRPGVPAAGVNIKRSHKVVECSY